MTSENDARSALEREIYWAEDASARSRMDTSEVRDLLHDFAMLMRADEKQAVPRGEPEFGELTAALADRVVALETEVKELRSKLGDAE